MLGSYVAVNTKSTRIWQILRDQDAATGFLSVLKGASEVQTQFELFISHEMTTTAVKI